MSNRGGMRYRKKPVEVDALQWKATDASWVVMQEFFAEAESRSSAAIMWRDIDDLKIKTLEGVMTANPGDWVIKGVKGEYYPCKPDIFAATYEAVE